ncbi:MAG: polysaccharide export protein [Alphaproteobacteria bacterium]|nr:polysaccharide export protein [Alphaproteobacteria bacterium]
MPSTTRLGRRALLAAAALPLVGCGGRGRDLPPLPPLASQAYRLGPGDQIRMITFGEDALSEIFRVSDTGSLALPLLGGVPAEGLTTDELSVRIAGLLKSRNILRNPSVSIEVTEYRPVFVLGEVTRPGQVTYQPGMSVLSAIAVTGGYTYRAVEDFVGVTRVIDRKPFQGRAAPTTLLVPGDIVTIYERYF